jgi:hypothetical protein
MRLILFLEKDLKNTFKPNIKGMPPQRPFLFHAAPAQRVGLPYITVIDGQFDRHLRLSSFLIIPITKNNKPIVRNINPDVCDESVKYALVIIITAANSMIIAAVKNIILCFFIYLLCAGKVQTWLT